PTETLTLTYTGGLVTQVADGTGNTWTYSYVNGRLVSVTAPGPLTTLTTSYSYDTGANAETTNALLSITYPDSSQQTFTYDPATGRLTGITRTGGAITIPITYTYVTEAEVTAADANNNQTTVWFTDLGLPGQVQDPLGGISTYRYDINGNLVTYT